MLSGNNGIVFDIHRFSLDDGPGIRTTVFLKGCPLHCEWCHNPESQSFAPQLSFNPDKCIDCFDCVKACPNEVHQVISGKHFVFWDNCKTSGECVKVCTHDALKIIGEEYAVREIINEVLKDRSYYDHTGGGLTISGGEPLTQYKFTRALLSEAKKQGLHTCVDTCGHAPVEKYLEIMPYTDIFLFDYKVTDEKKHRDFTGVTNKQILRSLEFLLNNQAKVILRCPLVPGVNDDDEHLAGIAKLLKRYPKISSVEIMPYHTMGRDKAGFIGREYSMKDIPSAGENEKQRWLLYYLSKGFNKPFLTIK